MKAPPRPAEGPAPSPSRVKLMDAVVDEVVEHDVEGTSAGAVAARAGLAEADFDREFDDLTECVLAAYWRATDEFTNHLLDAFEEGDSWRDSLRSSAYAAARWISARPRIVEFGTVKLFRAGLVAQAQRETHLHLMVDLIDCARQELDDPESMSRSTAEAVFGSIYETVIKGQSRGDGARSARSAESFVPEMMFLAVRPYLGHEAAQEELTIPPPPVPAGS